MGKQPKEGKLRDDHPWWESKDRDAIAGTKLKPEDAL
jgi:hypothetical protein